MKKLLWAAVLILFCPLLRADPCPAVVEQLQLPIRLKLGGKPKQARWALVEKSLTRLREAVGERPCQFTFQEVFSVNREDAFFPLIYNLLRTAPEESLVGAEVFGAKGRRLGTFANRVTFTKQGRSNYTHYYFQFKDADGRLQSGGNQFLIDTQTGKPFFLLRWDQLKDRVLLSNIR